MILPNSSSVYFFPLYLQTYFHRSSLPTQLPCFTAATEFYIADMLTQQRDRSSSIAGRCVTSKRVCYYLGDGVN